MSSTQECTLNATSPPTISSPRSDAEIFTQVTVLVIICVGSVFGNAFVVGIIISNYKLHKPTYYFISSLAVADFLVGALYIPFYIASSVARHWQLSFAWCKWHAAFISLSVNASLMTLCLVSVDRFLAITDPLRYQTTLTTRRSALLLLGGWIHSILWAVSPQLGWGEVVYDSKTSTCRPNWGARGLGNRLYALGLALFPFAVPVVCMVYCYCRIFCVARQHIKSIKKNSVQSSGSNASYQRAMETKAMKTLLLVLGAFVVAWLPYTVSSIVTMTTKGTWDISISGLNAVLTITTLNGCVNPVIYGIRDQRFRSGARRVLCPQSSRGARDFNSYASTKRPTNTQIQENVELGNINFAQ